MWLLGASRLSRHQTQLWADKLWSLMVQPIRKCDFSAWVRSARRRKRLRGKGERSLGELWRDRAQEAHSSPSRIHRFPHSVSQQLLHVPGSNPHAALQLENCQPKTQGKYFCVQSPASAERKCSQSAGSLSGCPWTVPLEQAVISEWDRDIIQTKILLSLRHGEAWRGIPPSLGKCKQYIMLLMANNNNNKKNPIKKLWPQGGIISHTSHRQIFQKCDSRQFRNL